MQELDLFKSITRTDRQEISRKTWIKNKCCGTIVACTGFGKTRVALNSIQCIINKYPKFNVLVVVPTETLKVQWSKELDSRGLSLNCNVQIVNTVAKHKYKANILVIDEIHRTGSSEFSKIFENDDFWINEVNARA